MCCAGAAQALAVGNLDATLIAQAPKLAPHVPAMRANIAADLGCAVEQVSVKATTTERLGFAGRGEGIAALATVLLLTLRSSATLERARSGIATRARRCRRPRAA